MRGAPSIRGNKPSEEAAGLIAPHLSRLEKLVLEWFTKHGPRSTEEACIALRMDGNTVRPRICALVEKGLLIAAGFGKTSKGRTCTLYDRNRLPANQGSLL